MRAATESSSHARERSRPHVPACLRIALLAFATLLLAVDASAWWDTNWTHRRKLTFDNSAQAENLMGFQVLVVLNAGRIDYNKTRDDGFDLRFVDANDTTPLLDYEIEKWDEAGNSFVWVRIPQVDASSSTDFIWMYYGNPTAPNVQNAAAVWAGYSMVHHLEEQSPSPHVDSTGNPHNSSLINVGSQGTAVGQIDGTDSFVRASAHKVEVPDSAFLDMGAGVSFIVEAWVRTTFAGVFQVAVGKESRGNPGDGEIMLWTNGGLARFWLNDGAGNTARANSATNVADDAWHYLVGRWNDGAGTAEVFVDGVSVASGGETPGALGAVATITPLVIGDEGDGPPGNANWDGWLDEIRVSKTVRSNNWIRAQNKSMRDNAFVSYGPEAAQCCGLGVTEDVALGTITVNGPNRFDLRFNTATGGGIDRFIDAEENTGVDLAGGVDFQQALFTHEVSNGVDVYSTGDTSDGVRLDLLEVTPARVKVRQEASYANDNASPPTRAGLKGFGDYSIYGIGRMAIGWETRATANVASSFTQLQVTVPYTGAAPWNLWRGYSATFGPVTSPFMDDRGPGSDAFVLAESEQPSARTDFLTIISEPWLLADNTFFGHFDPEDREEFSWIDEDPLLFTNGSSRRWNFLTYFKPTNMPDNSDLLVQGRSNDYRTPDVLVINGGKGSPWEDLAERTAAGDWFNEAEAAYVLDLHPTLGLDFDLDGSDPMDRYKPFFKIRQWRSFSETPTVTVETVPLAKNTSYRAAVKPLARAHFEKDLTWYSPLEGTGHVTSPHVGTGGTVEGGADFPAVAPYRHGYNARFAADGQYLSIPTAGNLNPAEGSIEFWYLPFYDYSTGGPDPDDYGLFGYWIDANNYFYAYFDPVPGGGPGPDEGLTFAVSTTAGGLAKVVTGAGAGFTEYWRANDWVHLRFVWKADPVPAQSRLEIYINGRLAPPSVASLGSYSVPVGTEANFAIGDRGRGDLFDNNAFGRIDEFRIYDMAEGATPLAHGGLTTDLTEHLANPANDYTFTFAQEDAVHRGEYLYLGADAKFRGLNVALAVPGIGPGLDLEWQYWQETFPVPGGQWADLEAVGGFTDQTNHLTTAAGTIFWTSDPTDWAPYSLRGGPDLYYVRARLKSGAYSGQSPREKGIKTDILLFQYCHDVTAQDRTFVFAPPLPTAVVLSSFTASGLDGGVDLRWTTGSELQNLGFHLYRADSAGGPYTRITSSLIPGQGSSPIGQSYSYRDAGLENGRTYYYELEDVETTGGTERHGPVSATPRTTSGGSGTPPGPTSTAATSYGDPSSAVLREVERSPSHVVLELLTGGFLASPADEGRVRLQIPGFESASRPGEPSLPMRRSFVEAASGKNVRLTSVLASDELRFPGLRPVSEGSPGIEVNEEGLVLPSEEKRREGRAFNGVFPTESALLLGGVFQGETKKAEVLFYPLRWDGSGLTLSRRLRVRLDFSGTEDKETSRGGSQGRRRVERTSHAQSGVVAQMVVKEKGLQRVDYEGVFGAEPGRRGRGWPESSLRLSRKGESVAFHVEPRGALFGPGSSLYFLSEGPDLNPYGDAVYELETNTTNRGLRMRVEGVASTSRAVSEYFQEARVEENHYYQAGLLEAPDLWLWDVVVSPGSKSFGFTVSELTTSSSVGRLSVEMQGGSDFPGVLDHHVRVRVNGRFVGETVWDGKQPTTLELELEPGVIQEGPNTLELEDVGDAGALYSMVFLNRFSVSYPRRLVASQGTLEGRFESTGPAEIEGLSASSFALDTTDVPRWLLGATATANGLSLSVEAGRSYLLTATVRRPEVKRLQPSRLRDTTNRADYLLLGPQAFLDAAQPLLDLRESQGLVTKAVSLEEIYEQFGHGEVSPEAIKEFLEYAYHFWAAPSPRYVLLLGDASYDPKDYLGTGVKDRLPGFPVRTSYLWTVSDPGYASVNGEDLLPDIAVGRLPAGSLDEALRMVEKTLSYENGGGRLDGHAVLVADNADLAGNFEADADEIASTVLASRNPRKIYYSQLGAATTAAIVDAFDQGPSLMSYMGHGSTVQWASEQFFRRQDVAVLALQPQQPLLMTLNCLNGFFHFPPLNSLSEELVKAEGKGAIGAFSPSGLSVNDPAHVFHKALLEEIVSARHERIGDAILAAQERYAFSGAFPELLSIYHLFGDPALRIR